MVIVFVTVSVVSLIVSVVVLVIVSLTVSVTVVLVYFCPPKHPAEKMIKISNNAVFLMVSP